jgi:hypothetical protein
MAAKSRNDNARSRAQYMIHVARSSVRRVEERASTTALTRSSLRRREPSPQRTVCVTTGDVLAACTELPEYWATIARVPTGSVAI